ncbi:MAG: hypothetical protein QW175_04660 [Candidatus Bathyarchaeia archaeon]
MLVNLPSPETKIVIIPISPPRETILANYIDITTFDLPATGTTGATIIFRAISRVIAPLPSDNPVAAMAVGYVDGPVDKVKLTVNGQEFELPKNYGVPLVNGSNPPVGRILSAGCWMTLTNAGKYKFAVETYYGHYADNTLYLKLDASQTKEIEITAPAVPEAEEGMEEMTKMLQEKLLPMMMSMMMLMMVMSMMSSMMASMREAFKKE